MSKYCNKFANKNLEVCVRALGPLSDVGMLANKQSIRIKKQIIDSGWNFINIKDATNFITSNFQSKSFDNCCLFNANWLIIKEQQPHLHHFIKKAFNETTTEVNKVQSDITNFSVFQKEINDYYLNENNIKKEIQKLINLVSGLNNVHHDAGLMSVGLNSIMIEDMRNKLSEKFNINLNVAEMYEFVNVNELSKLILKKLENFQKQKLSKKSELKTFSKRSTNSVLNKSQKILISENKYTKKKVLNKSIILPTLYNAIEEVNKYEIQNTNAIINLSNTNNDKLAIDTLDNENNKKILEIKETVNENKIELYSKALNIEYYKKFVKDNDIAIIGISGSFSGAKSISDLWDSILNKNELFTKCSKENKTIYFDYENIAERNINDKTFIPLSGIVPKSNYFDENLFPLSIDDIKVLDPQLRVSLLHAYSALENSGYLCKNYLLKIGCFIGAEPSAFTESSVAYKKFTRGSLNEMYRKNQKDFIAMWISHLLNLNGPSMAVYSACSTSLSAIEQASIAILQNKANMCLAGAVHLIPSTDIGHEFVSGMVLSSTEHCRPLTQEKDGGIIRGSGCSIVVLKLAVNAIKDGDNILGIIKSCAINNDGGIINKSNFMAPSVKGQTEVMLDAFKKAGNIQPSYIKYLECHATGTYVGDQIELKAISNVYFSKLDIKNVKPILVGSIKANIGHAFAASGMASIAKLLKILETKLIPPQLEALNENKDINNDLNKIKVVFGKTAQNINVIENIDPIFVALNSFGIGGTNSSAILMEGPKRFTKNSKFLEAVNDNIKPLITGNYAIIPISGASVKACLSNCKMISIYCIQKLKQYNNKNQVSELKKKLEISILKNIAFTLQNCRKHYSYRVCIVTESLNNLINKLQSITENNIIKTQKIIKTALFFCPQGVQYSEMLKTELTHSEYLQNSLNKFCKLYKNNSNNLKAILSSDSINDVKYTQCALFAICSTIVDFITRIINLDNKILFGHSVGEYTALVQAQMLDKVKCMELLSMRGQLMEK